jgi:hypothetical protein
MTSCTFARLAFQISDLRPESRVISAGGLADDLS